MSADPRFAAAITRLDAENARDPRSESVDGAGIPKELLYARRLTEAVLALDPDAPDDVLLAARAQHVRRWEFPRDRYPEGRAGYHRWRRDAALEHARIAGEILGDVGYDDATIARVQAIVRKEDLASDPLTQLLEDAIALVFIRYELDAFAAKTDPAKMPNIIRRTWAKMTPRGRDAALALPISDAARATIEAALAGEVTEDPESYPRI
ncbi:DUF4202 domain-containing protein [bacterium]|nr:DUF4202 domain-containing protein [bacterium]